MIQLYNTQTKTLVPFTKEPGSTVTMYHCGPTVYGRAHIGNLRSYVFADTLRRLFEVSGYTVKQVINITDVGHLQSDADEGEDKMTLALKKENLPLTLPNMKTVALKYEDAFKADLKALNCNTENTQFPRASDFISKQVDMIQVLTDKGFTYKTEDGIYFDTAKDPSYGKLRKIQTDPNQRIQNTHKHNPQDFALWKFNSDLGFDSPLGKGFPGWHIECSAMIKVCLGETIDIHTGGMDHIPVHHNNEIAQSENANGTELANIWMHNEFLTFSGDKMSKSKGNTLTLEDLEKEGITAMDYRFHLLSLHYQSPASIDIEILKASKIAYQNLRTGLAMHKALYFKESGELEQVAIKQFDPTKTPVEIVSENLNTPELIAKVFSNLQQGLSGEYIKQAQDILGLELVIPTIDEHEVKLISEAIVKRSVSKKDKDWKTADAIRDSLAAQGYIVKDIQNGGCLVHRKV